MFFLEQAEVTSVQVFIEVVEITFALAFTEEVEITFAMVFVKETLVDCHDQSVVVHEKFICFH